MKAFLQSSMAIFLGLCLLYAFYQKKMEQPHIVLASDIEMDSLYLADQQAFHTKQASAKQLNIEAILPAESKTNGDSVTLASTITDNHKKRKEKPKIEIYELKKSPKTNLATTQPSDYKLTQVITSQLKEPAPAETVTASVADANAPTDIVSDDQSHNEKKKKFLFFSKKHRNN